MIYAYFCKTCNKKYDILQGIEGEHSYQCPYCGNLTVREFTVPEVKKNEGFYSAQLGEWVSSHTEFEEKIRQVRYLNDISRRVGDNSNPRDQWVEERDSALQTERKEAQETRDFNEEAGAQRVRRGESDY